MFSEDNKIILYKSMGQIIIIDYSKRLQFFWLIYISTRLG